MKIPAHLADQVKQFAADYAAVTALWVRAGQHTQAEVETWRLVIRADMQDALGVNPALDGRSREERIKAWCATFREIAQKEKLC